MPSKLANTFYDFVGMLRAVSYRSFVEKNWSKPQPMLNIMEVKPGTVDTFKDFLKESLAVSLNYDTPISLGPFLNEKERLFIYITHYANTKAYMAVDTQLLIKHIAGKRTQPTDKTSWTYCKPSNGPNLEKIENILMVGIQGNPDDFLAKLNQAGITPAASIEKIKDVRGHALGHYYVFDDQPELHQLLDQFRAQGGDFLTYTASKM